METELRLYVTEAEKQKRALQFKYQGIEVEKPSVKVQEVTKTGVIYLNFANLMSIPRIEEISETTSGRRYLQEVSDG